MKKWNVSGFGRQDHAPRSAMVEAATKVEAERVFERTYTCYGAVAVEVPAAKSKK